MNIDLYNILDINLFSMAILLVIIANTLLSSRYLRQASRYRVLLCLSLLALMASDSLAHLRFPFSSSVNFAIVYLTNYLYFILQPLPISLSLMYIFTIYQEKKLVRFHTLLFLIPFFAGLLVMIYSFFTDFIFFIDESLEYHRGPGIFIYAIINYSFAVPVVALTFHYQDSIKRRTLFTIIAYTLIPYLGSFLQLRFYGISTAWPSFTLAVFITYIFLEIKVNEQDYLTGLLNRQNFEIKIHHRIEEFKNRGAFTLIVTDLNDFKQINDLYGHAKGDEVLRAVATLLNRSVSMRDTVARYGGDEFVLILDTGEKATAEAILKRITGNIASWNLRHSEPFSLSLSAGYAVYNPEIHADYSELFREADTLMFENKQRHKGTS